LRRDVATTESGGRALVFERIRLAIEYAVCHDPVLPGAVIVGVRCDGCERVESTDPHLVDDEERRERCKEILDIKSNSFPVELLNI
jgi:hypothetical protein